MKASEMTTEKFDEILPSLKFSLLQYPDRYAYEGAGPRCLIAEFSASRSCLNAEYDRPEVDGITVLFENGVYTVVGYDKAAPDYGDGTWDPWNVNIDAETGDREQII